jgi:hypothetical protein
MVQDLPLTGWTKKTIFDSIDQFIADYGRFPTAIDFKKKGLPPHPVIKLRFGVTLKDFLNMYYPTIKLCASNIYYNQTREYWQTFFIT